MYANNNCVFHYELPRSYQYMRNWNKGYLEWARAHAMTRYAEPITIHVYSEVLQKFRLAAQGKRPGKQPPERLRKRVETFFDPLPFYHETLESGLVDTHEVSTPCLDPATHGHVSLLGFAECLAAPDPYP